MLKHFTVVKPLGGNPTSKVHDTCVHQATKTHGRGLFRTREGVLMRSKPIDLIFRNHSCRQAFEEQLSEGHGLLLRTRYILASVPAGREQG